MAGCPKFVGGSGVLNYSCAEEEAGHLGPCWAREVQSSVHRRQLWEAEGARNVTVSGDQSPISSGVGGITHPVLDGQYLQDPERRENEMLASLRGSMQEVPEWVQVHLLGLYAQVSMAALWHLAHQEFEKGATGVVLTPEFLDRLITPSLKARFMALIRESH